MFVLKVLAEWWSELKSGEKLRQIWALACHIVVVPVEKQNYYCFIFEINDSFAVFGCGVIQQTNIMDVSMRQRQPICSV